MSTRARWAAGVVLALVAAGLALAGALAATPLAGLLICAGLAGVWFGSSLLLRGSRVRGWTLVALALFLTAFGMIQGDMGGRWLWLLPWLLEGLVLSGVGGGSRMIGRRTGETMAALGILLVVLAVLAPLFIYPALAGEGGVGAAGEGGVFNAADGIHAVGAALREILTSVWGWLTLAFLLLYGAVAWRRRGFWVAPAAVLVLVFLVGAFSEQAGAAVAGALGVSPASWFEDLLLATDRAWGSAGWGVLLLATAVVAASLPLLRKLLVMGQVAEAAARAGEGDAAAAARFIEREGYGPGFSLTTGLAFQLLYGGTVVLLWVALRRAASEAGALSFGFIPDVAVPSFRPVWDWPYFLLAGALGASAAVSSRVLARLSMSRGLPVLTNPVWQVGIVVLSAFVAPAGTLLFGLTATWLQLGAALPLSRRKRDFDQDVVDAAPAGGASTQPVVEWLRSGASSEGEEPEISPGFDQRPLWEREEGIGRVPLWGATDAGEDAGAAAGAVAAARLFSGEDDDGLEEGDFEGRGDDGAVADDTGWEDGVRFEIGRGSSPPVVVTLADAPMPLVDLALLGDDEFVTLSAGGDLVVFSGGARVGARRLRVDRPLGLGPVAGRRIAFVDGGGRALEVAVPFGGDRDGDEVPAEVLHSGVIGAADCCAVSPAGSIVVSAARDGRAVDAFFLESEVRRTLFEGVAHPTALGFAVDGALVAVGTTSGEVLVADLSGAGEVGILPAPRQGEIEVVAVVGMSSECWVVAYAHERVAVCSSGEPAVDADAGGAVTRLASDSTRGRIVAGTSFGLIRVFDEGLRRVGEARPFTSAVRRLVIEESGDIVCAGAGGEVRRVRLG